MYICIFAYDIDIVCALLEFIENAPHHGVCMCVFKKLYIYIIFFYSCTNIKIFTAQKKFLFTICSILNLGILTNVIYTSRCTNQYAQRIFTDTQRFFCSFLDLWNCWFCEFIHSKRVFRSNENEHFFVSGIKWMQMCTLLKWIYSE